jgi:hypothetical protein
LKYSSLLAFFSSSSLMRLVGAQLISRS